MIVILFISVGCTDLQEGGPLDQGYADGRLCTPVGADGRVTVGLDVLVNSGPDDLVLREVALAEPEPGMELIEALIVPVEKDLVGVVTGFPPEPEELSAEIQWSDAVPAVGARIPASGESGQMANLVVGLALQATTQSATTSGLNVRYKTPDGEFLYTTPNAIEIRQSACEN
jgi:hypothetical protein